MSKLTSRYCFVVAVTLGVLSTSVSVAQKVANPGYAGMTVDGDDPAGLRVVEVTRGGPADKGGVREGDLLLAINGKPLNNVKDLIAVLKASKVGARLEVIVERLGRRLQMRVTLAKPPLTSGRTPLLGLRTLAVTPELRTQFKLPMSSGAFVASVTKNSPAAKAGISAHVLIAKINGHAVRSPEDLLRWVQAAGPGGHVELIYYDQGRLSKKSLNLAQSGTARGIISTPKPLGTAPPSRPPIRALPKPAPVPTSDRQRIRLLEQRIETLEKRLLDLEKRHAKPE